MTDDGPACGPIPARSVAAVTLLSAAGGSLDAWVYIGHGHVFANAQTGNVVLAAVALAAGDLRAAGSHVPSFLAFCAGIVLSRLAGARLQRHRLNSRTIRLGAEAAALTCLATGAALLGDGAVTAAVGFLAAVHITALSHMDGVSFNTGMTTGNLRGALSAAVGVLLNRRDRVARRRAAMLGGLCGAFAVGAAAGSAATLRWGDPALLGTAAAVLLAAAAARRDPDPMP